MIQIAQPFFAPDLSPYARRVFYSQHGYISAREFMVRESDCFVDVPARLYELRRYSFTFWAIDNIPTQPEFYSYLHAKGVPYIHLVRSGSARPNQKLRYRLIPIKAVLEF